MAQREEPRRKPPFWHRSRLGWVNALGFALTVFLALWLLLVVFATFLPKAEAISFPIPKPYILACAVTQVVTIAMGAVIVVGLMWRGADFSTHTPRLYVFFWTCAGLLFYLCQLVTYLRFGVVRLPNVARFAEEVYWGSAPLGLVAFALMCYVNIEIPGADEHLHGDGDAGWDEEAGWEEEGYEGVEEEHVR